MSAPGVAFRLRHCSRAAVRAQLVAFLDEHDVEVLRQVASRLLLEGADVEDALLQLSGELARSRADILARFECAVDDVLETPA